MNFLAGSEAILNVSFGALYAGVATVGFTLKNPDGSEYAAWTAAGVIDDGGGYYHQLHTFTEEWIGFVEWRISEFSPILAREDIEVFPDPSDSNPDPSPGLYNPEEFLESTVRAIKEYASNAFNYAVLDSAQQPHGLEIYEIVMEFPGPALDEKIMPLNKTIIHFEIDGISDEPLGFGDNVFEYNFNGATQTVQPQDALRHVINFDVGIWASARSGGSTSRLRARQILRDIFGSVIAQDKFRTLTDGGEGCIEILRFQGGNFILDKVNDVPMYRTVDGQLEVRVFSRTPISDSPAPAIEEIVQAPGLTVLG